MKWSTRVIIVSIASLTMIFGSLYLLSSASSEFSEQDLTRSDFQGSVGVEVVFMNPLDPSLGKDSLVFKIYLTTHSGDISSLDLAKMSSLQTSDGKTVTDGISWTLERSSRHHPVGLLTVPATTQYGPVIGSETNSIQLNIDNLSGVARRALTWEKQYLASVAGGTSVARDTDGGYDAIVTNAADGTLSVVDLEAGKVTNTIKVGETASHGVAVSPDGSRIYVGDMDAGKLLIIDAKTHSVLARIPVGNEPHEIDFIPAA